MAGLSEEEFHRYQQGLIELKSANYQLEEEKRQLLSKVHNLEGSLAKKEEIISRSKKSRDFEQLVNDNDSLRRKILSQGEEFHLQQETLMKEYSTIVMENERLVQQLETYRADLAAQRSVDEPERETDTAEGAPTTNSPSSAGSDAMIEALRREVTELCRAKQALEEASSNAEKELRVVRSESEVLRADLERTRAALKDLEKQSSAMKQSLASKEAMHSRDLDALIAKHRKTTEELEESAGIRIQQLREDQEAALTRLRERHHQELQEAAAAAAAQLATAAAAAEERLAGVGAELEASRAAAAERERETAAAHAEEVERLSGEHAAVIADAEAARSAAEAAAVATEERHRDELAEWQQRVEDGRNAVKVQEKKANASMRDLKKQLIAEARRAEELQRRLEEVMVDATSRQSLEELFRPPIGNRFGEDGGSVRSWNASNSGVGTDNSTAVAGGSTSSPGAPSFGFTSEDVRLMIQRLTEAQQENCLLKEKVAHLEENNALLVEEVRDKSAIIERYVSESHVNVVTSSPTRSGNAGGGHSGVGLGSATPANNNGVVSDLERISSAVKARFGELVKGPESAANSKVMQKNLQRLLEETLTKNIHLEEHVLLLSNELERVKVNAS